MRKVRGMPITDGVAGIAKADFAPQIHFNNPTIDLVQGTCGGTANRRQCWLTVTESGDPRMVRISREVAEILIAWGWSHGD